MRRIVPGNVRNVVYISARACHASSARLSIQGLLRDSSALIDLPDLTEKERLYVSRQVSIIMKPRFIKYLREVNSIIDLDRSTEPATVVLDPSQQQVFDQMFPTRAGGIALTDCINVVRKFCHDFTMPEGHKNKSLFRNNLWSPLVTERTIAGLQVFGLIMADLTKSPYLPLLTFPEVAKVGKVSHVTEGTVKISRMKEYLAEGAMRGTHVQNKIRATEASLLALGFESFTGVMLEKVMNKFSRQQKIKYNDIDAYLSKHFIQWMCHNAELSDQEMTKYCGNPPVKDVQDIARNLYILQHVVGVSDKKRLVRAAVSIDPLETLVVLNAYTRVAAAATSHTGCEAQTPLDLDLVVRPSSRFPPTYRYLYLKSIGFTCQEAVDLMLRPKMSFQTKAPRSHLERLARARAIVDPEESVAPSVDNQDSLAQLGYSTSIYLPLMKERYAQKKCQMEGLTATDKWQLITEDFGESALEPRNSNESDIGTLNDSDIQSSASIGGAHSSNSGVMFAQQRRCMSTSSKIPPPNLRNIRKPKSWNRRLLGYLKNPFSVLENKVQEMNIRRTLDDSFDPEEVARGAKLAASSITKMIADNDFDGMVGLLTPRELEVLRRRVETEWSDQLRNNIALEPEDFDRMVNEGYVRQDFQGLATLLYAHFILEALADDRNPKFVIKIRLSLMRSYGEGAMHDWSVCYFNIMDAQVV